MNFQNDKKVCLSKIDKSKKGSIDSQILELVDCVNQNPHHYTTSSCSGRIVLQIFAESRRKDESEWLFVSHDLVDIDDFLNVIKVIKNKKISDEVWFRMEAMILHVACDSIENAQKLVDFARNNGFKRTGIQSTNKKILVEIVGSERVDTLVFCKGQLVVDESYIRVLIEKSKIKLQQNWGKINRLKSYFVSSSEV